MIKDFRYIIKRVIIGVLVVLVLSFIRSCDVQAQNLGIDLYINNTRMTGLNKLYTAGDSNTTIQLRQPSWEMDKNQYKYGYIAFCSATGKNQPIVTMSKDVDTQDAVVYTSEESCTIPTSTAYLETARVVYITYRVDLSALYTTYEDGSTEWDKTNLTFYIYQSGSTEYSLVGFGFSNSPYRVNTNDDLYSTILNSSLQKLTSIDGDLVLLNGKIDITNGKIDIVNGKLDITNGKLDYIRSDINGLSTAIINNNNSNTNSIINNQNQNTQDTIESQKVCINYNIDKNVSSTLGLLKNDGTININGQWYHTTDYIRVNKNETYNLRLSGVGNTPSYCLYDTNKTLLNCVQYQNNTNFNITPNQEGFIRFSFYNGGNNYVYFIGKYCKNGNQAIQETQEQTNSILTDSNVSIDSMPSDNIDTGPISGLLTLPITALSNIINAFNGTCSAFNIGSLFGTTLVFPCIDIESFIGSALWGTIDVIVSGIYIFSLRNKFVEMFDKLMNLENVRMGAVKFG